AAAISVLVKLHHGTDGSSRPPVANAPSITTAVATSDSRDGAVLGARWIIIVLRRYIALHADRKKRVGLGLAGRPQASHKARRTPVSRIPGWRFRAENHSFEGRGKHPRPRLNGRFPVGPNKHSGQGC